VNGPLVLLNKNSELVLTRRAKAYSSSCSQIVFVIWQLRGCIIFLLCAYNSPIRHVLWAIN